MGCHDGGQQRGRSSRLPFSVIDFGIRSCRDQNEIMLRDDRSDGGRRSVPARNVLGEPLEICSFKPMTGFYRDGCCNTGQEDVGSHTICAVMTAEFLAFSKSRGNDLSTPVPEFGFPGLKPGDRWCLCAPRCRTEEGVRSTLILIRTSQNSFQVRLIRPRLTSLTRSFRASKWTAGGPWRVPCARSWLSATR
jgi:uncharacterized protein